jgi:hypothetical protein
MNEIIQWCNTNSGFVMMIYVVATLIMVGLMVHANRLNSRSINIAVQLEKERSKPIVVLDVIPEIPFFRLRVRNTGLTSAHNVEFNVTPCPHICLGGKNAFPKVKTEHDVYFITKGIPSLPPGGEIATSLGTLARIEEGHGGLRFTGKIKYSDTLGGTHYIPVDLDLTMYRDLLYSGKKTIHNVANEMENVAKELRNIATGFSRPHVLTQDIRDFRKEQDEQIEQAMKALEEKKGEVE